MTPSVVQPWDSAGLVRSVANSDEVGAKRSMDKVGENCR